MQGPIFLLSGGGRTGSTLLQRLLLSSRQVLLWGEHGGALLHHLLLMQSRLQSWLQGEGGGHLEAFREGGHNSWVANMNPPLEAFRAGFRALLDQSLGAAASRLGRPRWGFKEIRYGRDAVHLLHTLYPEACFLFLVRHPVDWLRSIKGTGWYGADFGSNPTRFVQTWARLSRELADVQPLLPRSLLLRFEDLTSHRDEVVGQIAAVCGIPEHLFDATVFAHAIRGTPTPPEPLTEPDWKALADYDVRRVADRFGYRLP